MAKFIKQLPNILTTLRLILAVPIMLLLLNKNYPALLGLVFIAGVSDIVDGYLARNWHVETTYGTIVDPLADKALLLSIYIAFGIVSLIPCWLVVVIVLRDLLIVSGVCIYRIKFGSYYIVPSLWGKLSTAVQIIFAFMLLIEQIYPFQSPLLLPVGLGVVTAMAFVSGGHYLYIWGVKIIARNKANG